MVISVFIKIIMSGDQYKFEILSIDRKKFCNLIKNKVQIETTISCGDGYTNEYVKKVCNNITGISLKVKPDLLVAGHAINVGYYVMTCARAAKVAMELGIPVISRMYKENTGWNVLFAISTRNSATSMRQTLPDIVSLICMFLKKIRRV